MTHNSIYWNGAVYIIVGQYHDDEDSSFKSFFYEYAEDIFAEHESSEAAYESSWPI